jgi:hypothetical protein
VNRPIPDPASLARRHLAIGWSALFVFVSLGLVLEGLLAFKEGSYLDVGQEGRRAMWRLAHTHGTGLAFVHLVYGLTLKSVPTAADALASACFIVSLGLIPVGFFGGGIALHGGDPGAMIFAVPPGAVALALGVLRVASSLWRAS